MMKNGSNVMYIIFINGQKKKSKSSVKKLRSKIRGVLGELILS